MAHERIFGITTWFSCKADSSFKAWVIIFPNHGSKELGRGLEKKIFKQAGIKK